MDEQLKDVLSLCSVNTQMTALTFFPERFYAPFADNIHGEIFKLIDGPANKVAVAAPRGWGKTSIVALAYMARHILFNIYSFIVYINKSETAAIMQTENLKRELVSNRHIRAIKGPVKTRTASEFEIEESFSKKAWVAYDTFVLPRGAGQQVRGVLYKNDRPGLFVIDDLEDKKKVMNEELRKELKNWFYADVLEAIPQLHMNWKIVYIDTLKHEDSLLQHLLESPDWKSVRLEACGDDFKSTAPDFVSDEIIQSQWDTAVRAGQTDTFFQEKRNLPISTKDASFKREYFHYYNRPGLDILPDGDIKTTDADLQANQNIENLVIVDPAKTVKMNSAESAIIGFGIDMTGSKLFIRDIISEKMYPDELYKEMFGMSARLKAQAIGVEVTSLNEFIKQPIKNYMFKNGTFYELVWLNPRGGQHKEDRIKELVPYYRLGFIYHNFGCAGIKRLEAQLIMFPRSKLMDIMDAAAYVIQMLELGERYMSPNFDESDPEAEYRELSYDPVMQNWRCA